MPQARHPHAPKLAALAATVLLASLGQARADFNLTVVSIASPGSPGNGAVAAYDQTTGSLLTTFAIPPSSANAYYPRGVTTGPDGNVYIGEIGLQQIGVYKPDGTFQGVFSQAPNNLQYVYGMAFSGANLYAANFNGGSVVEFDATGHQVASTGPGLTLASPAGLAVDAQGNVYVGVSSSGSVVELNSTLTTVEKTFTVPNFDHVTGVAIANGLLYASGGAADGTAGVATFNLASGSTAPQTVVGTGLSGRLGGIAVGNGILYLANFSTTPGQSSVLLDQLTSTGDVTTSFSTFLSGLTDVTNVALTPAVPEPSSVALLAVGTAGLLGGGVLRTRKSA